MTKTIKVNGNRVDVVNTLSCGPGEKPHTYVCRNADGLTFEVECIAGTWKLYSYGFGSWTVAVELEG